MERTELLDQLRGDMTKIDFADKLGISSRMLTALYSGSRQPGRLVLQALVETFPERQEDIIGVFLLSDSPDCASSGTIVPEEAA